MIEGFDVRTLALTNLLLGVVLGLGLLTFAHLHSSFNGLRRLGFSYIFLALSFLLLGLREYINDWFSIILANSMLLLAFTLFGCGLFSFFNVNKKNFLIISTIIQIIVIPSFIYFTFVNTDTNSRIILISIFISVQLFYIALNLKNNKEDSRYFLHITQFTFLFCALFFLFRAIYTFSEPYIQNYMDSGVIHGLSLLVLQLLMTVICFTTSWSASQKLEDCLAKQATIDPLTQVYNRRALEEFSEKSLAQARREKTNIVVILMDIDDFKTINDKYGHQAGDQVLIEFSHRLKKHLREYDTIARFGGEEFLLILPHTELIIAQKIAEKLRNVIAAPVFFIQKNIHVTITASFGIAIGQGELLQWEQLVSQADMALYQAKRAGKNRVNTHLGDVIIFDKSDSRLENSGISSLPLE